MDMRDIEQLHAQYAQPPLTIDISPAGAATAPHLGYGGTSSAPANPSTSPFPFALGRNQLLWGLGFIAIAALMFAIGTSIGKRESRAGTEQMQPLPSASDAFARVPAGNGHEWPRKTNNVPASEVVQSTVLPVSAEAAVASASTASVAPVPEEQPKAETVKRSAAPAAPAPALAPAPTPAPARAATIPAPARTVQQLPTSAAAARNTAAQHANSATDIKMF